METKNIFELLEEIHELENNLYQKLYEIAEAENVDFKNFNFIKGQIKALDLVKNLIGGKILNYTDNDYTYELNTSKQDFKILNKTIGETVLITIKYEKYENK